MASRRQRTDGGIGEGDDWTGDRRPDPGLFFAGPAHVRFVDLIRHLAENSGSVALVVGPQGAGKTTLLYRILAGAEDHWLLCRVDANPMMHPDQLLGCMAGCVGLGGEHDDLAPVVAEHLAKQRLQGRLPVVLVDDADQLPVASLMTLLRLHELQAEGLPAFALILLAEPAIDAFLAAPQVRAMGAEKVQRLELPLLSEDEAAAYIPQFLRLEGVSARVPLTGDQVRRIHREAAGVPGRINELVIHALREGRGGGRRGAALHGGWLGYLRHFRPSTLVAVLAALLVVGGGLLYQDRINALFSPPAPPPTARLLPLPPPAPPPRTSASPTPMPSITSSAESDGSESPRAQPATGIPIAPIEPPAPTVAVVETPAEPHTPPAALQPPVPPLEPAPPPAPVVELPGSPAPGVAVPAEPGAAGSKFVDAGLKKEAWLMRQSPDAYSLQLLAVADEQSLLRYVRKHGIEDQAAYFEGVRNGRPWYALLYGSYPDRAAASRDLERLPADLRKAGAWPRPFRALQAELKARAP